MSEIIEVTQTEEKKTNPVAILGVTSFISAIASYLLCGFLFLLSLFAKNRISRDDVMGSVSAVVVIVVLLGTVLALVGLVTGITGVAIRRSEKLEGRGFAVTGLAVSGSYILIMLILLIMAFVMMIFSVAALQVLMN